MRRFKPLAPLLVVCALMVLSGCVAPDGYVVEHYETTTTTSAGAHYHHSASYCNNTARSLHTLPVAYQPKQALRYALTQLHGHRLERLQMTYQTNDSNRWGHLRHRNVHVAVDLSHQPQLQGTECVSNNKLLRSLFALASKSQHGWMHFDHALTYNDWSRDKGLFYAAENHLFKNNFCSFTKACFDSARYQFSFSSHQAIEVVVDSMSTMKIRFIGFPGIRPSQRFNFWKSDFKTPKRILRHFQASFADHHGHSDHHHHHRVGIRIKF